MRDDVRAEEENRLKQVINGIDEILNRCDIWLHQSVNICRMDKDELRATRIMAKMAKGDLERVRDNPYFGRIDVIDDTSPAVNTYYFGRYGIPVSDFFLPSGINKICVLSMFNPIARLFYEPWVRVYEVTIKTGYSENTIKHTCKVTLKRQIIIENTKIKNIKDEFRTKSA